MKSFNKLYSSLFLITILGVAFFTLTINSAFAISGPKLESNPQPPHKAKCFTSPPKPEQPPQPPKP